MTSIHHAHQRTPPPHLKKTVARSHRSSVLPRALSSPKLAYPKSGKSKPVPDSVAVGDDDDDMATSFLQYWYAGTPPAMCEKQILVPNNSILYCSERCRRKDGENHVSPDSYLSSYTTNSNMSSEPVDVFSATTRSIVPRRKPTAAPSFQSIPPVLHNAKADLDPTEWKPDLKAQASTEAFEYLSKFHRAPDALTMSRRPILQGRHTSALMMAHTAPSLSHTPTTSMTSSEGSIAGTPYEFVATEPKTETAIYSTSTLTKSIDYVNPAVAADDVPTPIAIASVKTSPIKNHAMNPCVGDLDYTRKWVPGAVDQISGSLKKLLYLQQMSEAQGIAEM
ncbi:hypothetical protein MMC30_005242 [Trapelia coarctata]|nr:hypothetical protein [Trapelia coarctata]